MKTEESETPIYNMVLELGNINLYELSLEIEKKGGVVLDLNTDCIVCEFEKFPFKLDEYNNIIGYYHDKEHLNPKYKLENGTNRVKYSKLQKYVRIEKYKDEDYYWNLMNDPGNNNFKSIVDAILDSGKSFNIEGRAGTGKSFMVNSIIKELKKRNINFKALAPTNKSARIINGETIHKFIAQFKLSHFEHFKYIFIDEISMMQELFYKFFIYLKRAKPELKFILVGDFEQLPPVNDRLGNRSFEDSRALYELCDGNKLKLRICRRADDKLFNMLKKITLIKSLNQVLEINLPIDI